MKTLLTGLLLWPMAGMGQFYAQFKEDGFFNNPAWLGDTSSWQIRGGQLSSNSLIPNNIFWLSTPSGLAVNARWEFYVQLKFNTSSLNYTDIYVVSDSANLQAAGNTGYFIRIGNTEDAVSLYRKDTGTKPVKILAGRDGTTNHSNNTLKVKLLRNSDHSWSLFIDSTGKGGHYQSEGECIDSTYSRSAYFGILVRQSTASFFQKHFFADIEAAPLMGDTTPTTDTTAIVDTTLVNNYVPRQYDVIITEIFPNPAASPGLPPYEFVELKNRSVFPINLSGWKFGNNVRSATLPEFILEPDSLVILCGRNAATLYQAWGATLGMTNFPAMKNGGDTLLLSSADGSIMHTLAYDQTWYADENKSRGGWSLEMIDTGQPCSGKGNWSASKNPGGGTPGSINSVNGPNKDETLPDLLRAYPGDSLSLELVFSKPLALHPEPMPESFRIDHDNGLPASVKINPPFFNTVTLRLLTPLQPRRPYTVKVTGLPDCSGNLPGLKNTVRFGLAEPCDSFDMVINEILFNPTVRGKEFVEIYNRSQKILDLKTLRLANRDKNGLVASVKIISRDSRLLFPGEYLAITQDRTNLQREYFCPEPDALLEVPALPSYPNKSGTVMLLREDSRIIDEFAYQEQDHHPLISNPKGISLERADYHAPTQDPDNWHSAASTTGYATPGYQNSQFMAGSLSNGFLKVSPEVFTPGGGGMNNRALIEYSFPEPGCVANIIIFDAAGRIVHHLAKNALLGTSGKFSWDGTDENHCELRSGIYIIYFEAFNRKGATQKFKKTVVLGRSRF